MRIANIDGVAHRVQGEEVSSLGILPMEAFAQWDELKDEPFEATGPLDLAHLGCPVPSPSQVFAVGLNYKDHAAESGMPLPELPMVFTKFPSCLSGPFSDIPLVPGTVDWEVELVVVIGAGFTVGQDISERERQKAGAPPQFSLGKSYRGFGPLGPWVTDEVDGADLGITCAVNGELRQQSRTSQLIFDVPALVEHLGAICELRPGDLIFTGTPAGVGMGMKPPVYLQPGDVVESWIEGIGTLRNTCV